MNIVPAFLRRWPAAVLPALLLGGCGFHLAGTVQHLPAVMAQTCIQSEEPYGYLENQLRNAIRAQGSEVTDTCTGETAVLAIVDHSFRRRVLAVNARGQPQEYLLTYRVTFRLNDAHGKTLLKASTLKLQSEQAYAITNELGAGRRQGVLLQHLQREASRLIMLRLASLHARTPPPAKN